VIVRRLIVRVPGRPAVQTAQKLVAEPWKWAVANAVRERWNRPYIEEPCGVALIFRLDLFGMKLTALHNLLKATIDGLSHALFEPGGPGHPGPWNNHDWWITRLSAQKVLAIDEPCVDI